MKSINLHNSGYMAGVLCLGASASAGSISLSGDDAEGFFAVVNLNQEGGTTPAQINSDPTASNFFDYPVFVNPLVSENVFVVAVEPYVFGLEFPDPLFPSGPGTFESVGPLQQRDPVTGLPPAGATFVDGFTEDDDFNLFDIGTIDYDENSLTGVGTETIGVNEITLTLDGSEFQSQNRDPSFQNGDFASPDGRSNNNEFANIVTITPSNLTGDGLTFQDGELISIAFAADVAVNATGAGFGSPSTLLGFDVGGTLTFDGLGFAFDVDGIDTTPFASNVRVLLNRSGTVIPEPTTATAILALSLITLNRRRRESRGLIRETESINA